MAATEAAECIHVREAKKALHHLIMRVDVLGLCSMTLVAAIILLAIGVRPAKGLLASEHVVL